MAMKKVPFACPDSLEQAVETLVTNPGARALAGGTDLFVQLEKGAPEPPLIVSLHQIKELQKVTIDQKTLRLGGCVSLATIAEDTTIAEAAPLLAQAAQSMASPPIRTRGTIGGNLCNASPAADLAPPLLVHDARVLLQGKKGKRELALKDFLIGPGQTALAEGELLVTVIVPRLPAGMVVGHTKHQVGVCGNLSIMSMALGLVMDGNSDKCLEARVGLGAVAPTAIRSLQVEERLRGSHLDQRVITKAAEIAGRTCSPIDDVRASCDHRCHLVEVLLPKLIMNMLHGTSTVEH